MSHRPTAERKPAVGDAFDALLTEAMPHADRFGHREHVHLTWLAVRRYGTTAAVELVSDAIQRTARYAGAPQKYHATVSRPGWSSSATTRRRATTASTPLSIVTRHC